VRARNVDGEGARVEEVVLVIRVRDLQALHLFSGPGFRVQESGFRAPGFGSASFGLTVYAHVRWLGATFRFGPRNIFGREKLRLKFTLAT